MVAANQQCIYCPTFFDPSRGQGDHVLGARAFGEFKDDIRFRGVCTACNNRFGRNEQQLSQASPIGFYRSIVKPNLGRRKNRGSLRQGPAMGAPAPKFVAQVNDQRILVIPNADSPRDGTPADQLVIEGADDRVHHIRLYHGMSEDSLRSAIANVAPQSPMKLYFQCDEADSEHFKTLISSVFPKLEIVETGVTESGTYQVPLNVEFTVTTPYFQSLAKIAFHYYLTRNRRGLYGSEPEFSEIRKFIVDGGEMEQFFHSSGRRFAVPFGEAGIGHCIAPHKWCHILAVNETADVIVVYIQLFVGPGSVPPPKCVTLGRTSSPVFVPSGAWGSIFSYDPAIGGKYAGTVREVALTPYRHLSSGSFANH